MVVKRDGRLEPYNHDKLRAVILWACNDSAILADQLLEAVNIKIYNKIHITKLYDELINTASNMISDLFPIWEDVAKNLYLLKLHKEIGVKRAQYPHYSDIVYANEAEGFYSTALLDTLSDLGISRTELGQAINPEYDKLFTFGGLNLFVQKYCNKTKGKLLELPQHVYMRVAIQLMYKSGIDAIIRKYHQLAQHQVTEATPKMVNALKPNASMFSCCLNRPSDSLEGINESITMLCKESKFSGGDAWDVSLVRAPGAIVEGNKGHSSGCIPYIKYLQEAVGAYNQG